MGVSASAPVIEEFSVQHKLLVSHLIQKPPAQDYRFQAPQKLWRKELASVNGAGVTLQADSEIFCSLTNTTSGEIQAVLKADIASKNRVIQVCSFSTPEKGAASVCQYDGRCLYAYGTVTRKIQNRELLTLELTSSKKGVSTFRTESCGSCLSKQKVILIKRDGLLCASLVENKSKKVWNCALLACFDKFPQMDEAFLKGRSSIMPNWKI